jgi:hypothetical protein
VGTFESNVTDGGTWQNLYTGAYCDYNNDVSNVAIYGRLNNWNAIADSPNTGATNEGGFTALPGSYSNAEGVGFQGMGSSPFLMQPCIQLPSSRTRLVKPAKVVAAKSAFHLYRFNSPAYSPIVLHLLLHLERRIL